MSDQHDEARSAADEELEPGVRELSDEALDAVSGGKEAAMNQVAPGS
jgi:hypothetical protein